MTDADVDPNRFVDPMDRGVGRWREGGGGPLPAGSPEPPGEREGGAGAGNAPPGQGQDFDAAMGPTMSEASLEYWASLDEDSRQHVYDQLASYYGGLLEEFRVSANLSVAEYKNFSRLGQSWRYRMIVLTGGLALLNVLATSWPDKFFDGTVVRPALSFAAAIYAVLLALVTNLESYRNYADKKLGARDSRELFLDAYREFEMLRLTHVYPFGYSPQGCYNFHALYRRLVTKDVELRRKLKQLSTTDERSASAPKAP
jgi:hypothetical protein